MSILIEPASDDDVDAIRDLLNTLIATPLTYTERFHDRASAKRWLHDRRERALPVLMARDGADRLGLASYAPFRASSGYRFTVEHSIYVAEQARGKGVAVDLLNALSESAIQTGLHSLIAGIDSDNQRALNFHRRHGFFEVGRIPEAGYKLESWRTLVLMQRLLKQSL